MFDIFGGLRITKSSFFRKTDYITVYKDIKLLISWFFGIGFLLILGG